MTEHDPHHADDGLPSPDEWLIGAPKDKPDRWAHRRGEPRGFALIWSCYLLGACAVTLFGPASSLSFDAMYIRSSSKMLIAVVILGIVLVWPMFRLSQTPPRHPARAALVDLLIVLAPCLAIVASTSILTRWPLQTSGAMLAVASSWSLLLCAFLALATRWDRTLARALSMLAVLAAISAGLLVAMIGAWSATLAGATPDPELWRIGRLLSPVSAPFAIASHPTVAVPLPDTTVWVATLAPLALAVPLWICVGLATLSGARERPQDPARPGAPPRGYS